MGNIFGRRKRPRPTPPVVPPVEPGVVEPPFSPPESSRLAIVATGVKPIGMSYWRNINQHINSSTMDIVLSVNDELVVFTVDKYSLQVLRQKALGINHTGEGVSYSRIYPSIFYYGMGREYYKYDVYTGERQVVWSSPFNLWQVHMDYSERTFSGSLKDDNWNIIGWGVNELRFDLRGSPDECQIDKSGDWLVIKENDYNRIVNINTGAERIIQNTDGALGHSDNGFNCILGENDFASVAGACEYFNFQTGERKLIYSTGLWNMGYVSFTNAYPNTPIESQKALISSADGRLILVRLDGSLIGFSIADIPPYYDGQPYEDRPKANLCPNGEFAVWTEARSGNYNAYVVRVP